MIFLFIFSILSFLGLWLSANWIVNSSSKIASYFGISSLVIGLTIVSFGTSAPEFAVSLSAALSGNSDISVSNIVGSNIFNLGFILGSVALFCPISTSLILLKRDCSVLIFSSFLLLVFLRDGLLSRAEGILFIFFLIGYLFLLFFSKREEKSNKETKDLIKISDFIFLILGLVLISISSKVLIHCSS